MSLQVSIIKSKNQWAGWRGSDCGGDGDAPVVGGREDGDTVAAVRHLVALSLDLVAADDVVQVVLLQEGLGDIGPKLAAHAPLTDRAPILGIQGA